MMSSLIHWAASISGCCIVLVLVVGLFKDGMEFARGQGSVNVGGMIAKALALIAGVGIMLFVSNMNFDSLDNSLQIASSESGSEAIVDEPAIVVDEPAAEPVVEEPEPIVEEVAEEPAPIVTETAQPTTEVVQAEPVVSTPDPNWMPKDTLEESWNYAIAHKWTIMYKGKEMDPKYISYKYYNITFDKDKYIVTLTDK